MQSYQAHVEQGDQFIPLPYDIRLPDPVSGIYALPQPNDPEWTVLVVLPVSAAELSRNPDLRQYVMHAGGLCAPSAPASTARSPLLRAPHLRVLR